MWAPPGRDERKDGDTPSDPKRSGPGVAGSPRCPPWNLSPVGAPHPHGLTLSPAPPPAKGAGRAAPLLAAAPG